MDPVALHASERPDDVALIAGERQVTWAELDRRGNQAARALRRRGVGPGDRVSVAFRNSIEYFDLMVGAGRLAAIVNPVSFRFMRDEVEYMVGDSQAKVVFGEPDNEAALGGLTDVILRGTDYDEWLAAEDDRPLDDAPGQTLSGLRYYTSGTTGRPKAIVRDTAPPPDPQAAAQAMAAVMGARLGVIAQPGEVHLLAAVLYHTAPGAYAHSAVGLGHTVVIMDGFDAEEALRLIERHKVSWSQMAPIHLVRMVGLPEDVRKRHDLSSVKRILHAGAPTPVEVKWKALELFPGDVLYEYYAATEGYATECPASEWVTRPGTVGRAAPGIEIHILDDDGNEVGPGEVGTVYVRSGARFEYEGAPEKTAETWRGDMYAVGDMGYLDADGYLFLTDRKTHMIISGGANIYPAEVENVLFAHPAVADVAVIGVPDDEFGEQVKALVETRSPVSAEELIAFTRERLAHYKCPKSVDFVETLPRDPNGKIRKKALRDPYWEGRATRI